MKQRHFFSNLSRADYVTSAAIIVITSAFWIMWNGAVTLAIALAFVSTFLDYLDGVIARRYGGSPYGKVLDSLYDILGWVLFPALVINVQTGWAWWSVIISTTYCLFAALRLARFTVEGYVESSKRYYVGLPVLFSKYALLVVFAFDAILSSIILLAMIPLMVSSYRIPKPHPATAQLELIYAALFLWVYFTYG